MLKSRRKALVAVIAVVIIAIAVAAYIFATPPRPYAPSLKEKVTWVIATSSKSGVGYFTHSALADVIMRQWPDYFEITVSPAGGAAGGTTAWDIGEADLGYTSMGVLYEYITKTGSWDPTKTEAKRYDEVTVIAWEYPIIYGIFVTEDLKDKVKCWSDLKKLGKSLVLNIPQPTMGSYRGCIEALTALFDCTEKDLWDIFTIAQTYYGNIADLLVQGKVKAVWAWGEPGGPASGWAQAFARYNYRMVAVPPTESELQKILKKSTALIPYTMDLKPWIIKTVDGKDAFVTVAEPYGLLGSKKLSKDHVYLFFEAHIKFADMLEETGISTFKNYKNWFLQFCIEGFKKQSTFRAKIHPGVAECLKNYGYDPKSLGILVAGQ